MQAEARRLLQALEMQRLGYRLKREALRREHPAADEAAIRRLFLAWLNEVRYDLDEGMRLTMDPPRFRAPPAP